MKRTAFASLLSAASILPGRYQLPPERLHLRVGPGPRFEPDRLGLERAVLVQLGRRRELERGLLTDPPRLDQKPALLGQPDEGPPVELRVLLHGDGLGRLRPPLPRVRLRRGEGEREDEGGGESVEKHRRQLRACGVAAAAAFDLLAFFASISLIICPAASFGISKFMVNWRPADSNLRLS